MPWPQKVTQMTDSESNNVEEHPADPTEAKAVRGGAGLEALYGICAEAYGAFGGGEAYLKAERDWGPDAWERYEIEEAERLRQEQIGTVS